MDLGKKLSEIRKTARITRPQLVERLKQKGFDVKTYTIGKWETGVSKPTVEVFLAICDICGVQDISYTFTGKRALALPELLDGLNPIGREHAKKLLDVLKDNPVFTFESGADKFVRPRLLRLYDLPVSAGTGNYLDEVGCEMIEIDNAVPSSADYAVKVSGDSMMPRFVDQQIIFIHEQPVLGDGEIGIFCLNNDVYLKKLERGYLVSLNPAYKPIPILDYDDFRVFGKVVG